jgi:S1-C subfamily serine protease
MNTKPFNREDAHRTLSVKLLSLLALMILLIAGCAPPAPSEIVVTREGASQQTTVIQPETKQITAKPQGEVSPINYEATPAAAAMATSEEARTLEETLVHLYQKANPAVVTIVLPSGSTGSGFVYDEAGHIVTNRHVVANGRSYEVVFATGERQYAALVGADTDSDLAVLRVEELPEGVTPLSLGDETTLQVGQFAVAIGNPFGEQGSMSLGIISGLGRSLRSQRATTTGSTYSLPQVIQTDAPINPGNSGGPLLNLAGEVIGVNAAIVSATGTNSGVGFSIPVAVVKRVAPSLIEHGEVAYSYMGASFDGEISLEEQEQYDLPQTQGSYVISVVPGSPADEAGLVGANAQTGRGGDLVIAIDGQPIDDFSDLNTYLVFETEPGQTLQMTVLRDGERMTLPLTLGARP